MLRRVILMLTLAVIAVLVMAPAAQSKTVTCKSGQVCKGTSDDDLIFGSTGNDNIRPMAATTMCLRTAEAIRWPIATAPTGSLVGVAATRSEAASASTESSLTCHLVCIRLGPRV